MSREGFMENPKIHISLTGFSQVMEFRVFTFEVSAADQATMPFTVRVDLAMARRYGIRLQELPLLCRTVLDGRHGSGEERALTYTEEDMSSYCAAAREQAIKNKKPPRRPNTGNTGETWESSPR
jgi:hypothetical protein